MRVHDFALRVVTTDDLATKLAPSESPLDDSDPGPRLRLAEPGRPVDLPIRPGRQVKVPRILGMGDPAQRARILHALANHELQAAELFAWALLAFPDAPSGFRRGLLAILDDEQRHTRMYIARLRAHGHEMGDFPVTGYFWNKVDGIVSPLHFVSAMSLTFENANLDHTAEYAEAARRAGDEKTAKVIDRIGEDEIEHVRFGWRWLRRLGVADADPWETWNAHLTWPLRPLRARGESFQTERRRAAGLDDAFIEKLRHAES
ncbi:MAG: DUF455 family protein [Acidobacteriota bacterium]